MYQMPQMIKPRRPTLSIFAHPCVRCLY